MWIDPIYDRTLEDVQYANANRDSPQPLKGARNYTDLNRIAGNIHYLSDILSNYGYVSSATCKTAWTLGEVPSYSEFMKIQSDLISLRYHVVGMVTTPVTPGLPYTHYQKINDIEKILFDTEQMIENMAAAWFYSDELYSGEV